MCPHPAPTSALTPRRDWLEEHKKEIIANAVHGAGGKIEELMNENKDEEWFDFANELEEVSDDD
jgi:hypothetical protein